MIWHLTFSSFGHGIFILSDSHGAIVQSHLSIRCRSSSLTSTRQTRDPIGCRNRRRSVHTPQTVVQCCRTQATTLAATRLDKNSTASHKAGSSSTCMSTVTMSSYSPGESFFLSTALQQSHSILSVLKPMAPPAAVCPPHSV